ncbi:LacI family DNA-binding transcriptional regulator [Cytophagaceae bacterium YF14B1]|uniref:LacI family DNA-binding transcriptional regulator n=1 Tax=Xanthocytophaga flava TaxID=3048013 RepID=A0AAE3QMS4_9BACT|nr:LacI family DNA-binding transcriptional regulator [Xanthocytophaga flavus]MDJ1479604.1 LacI family DNA-binding transcriptional regulator [Xanthocytophaga flavus]
MSLDSTPKIITIKDIAQKFKCSPSTVSRALNNHPLINIETRNTIQEYARRMGYQKNSVSLSLLNKSTKIIGVILPNISHFHEAAMVNGLQSVLQPLGYLVNICITNESQILEKEYVERLLSNRVDAIFMSVSQETYDSKDHSHLEQVLKRNIPLIFIDREYDHFPAFGVTINDYQGAYRATQHLIEVGCKRIAHLRGPKGLTVAEQRYRGYIDCLNDHHLPVDKALITETNFNIESGLKPTQYLLNLKDRPNGIFGVNDQVCFGALKVIKEYKLNVPTDIALVGFDNSPIAEYFQPSLTSVKRQSKQIGTEAARLFIESLTSDSASVSPQNCVLDSELIVRDSSRRL